MKHNWLFFGSLLSLLCLGPQGFAQNPEGKSFMDLWCQYGGSNCTDTNKARQPAQARPPRAPSPLQNPAPVTPAPLARSGTPAETTPATPSQPSAATLPATAPLVTISKFKPQNPAALNPGEVRRLLDPRTTLYVTQSPNPTPAPAAVATLAPVTPPSPKTLLVEKTSPKASNPDKVNFGRYHALVIGNNNYRHLRNLNSANGDASAVAKILRESYGFKVSEIHDATRDQIISALDRMRETLGEDDNLLIYYAGHGWLDDESERGYWLPIDAQEDSRSRWLSNADITDTLKAVKSRRVMVVADSCYSGALTRSITRGIKMVDKPPDYLKKILTKKSRTVLSSGGLEPVIDSGGGKHSVFAQAFLQALNENSGIVDGTQIFAQVREQVRLNARQVPQYANIRFAGHEVGSDFVFVKD